MARTIHSTRQFERDVKLQKRRGKDTDKLKLVILSLVADAGLPSKNHDHALSGDFAGYRECHIESDWLLIYKLEPGSIHFVRTGTHSDLF